jgi:hypothetical protein
LKFINRLPYPPPDQLPFSVAAFEHQIGEPGRLKLGIGAVLTDQQVCSTPNLKVGDHRAAPSAWFKTKASRTPALLSCVLTSCVAMSM